MGNFKIGDVVKRRLDAGFLHTVGPEPHVVTGVDANGWLQINHWWGWSGHAYPWSPQYFTLVDGVDDELPPAPENGLYFNHNGTRSASLKLEGGVLLL